MRLMCFICWWMFVNMFAYIMEWEGIWKRIFFCIYVCSYIKRCARACLSLLFVYFLHVIMCASWWCICNYSNSNNYNKRHWRCTNNKRKKTSKDANILFMHQIKRSPAATFLIFLNGPAIIFLPAKKSMGVWRNAGRHALFESSGHSKNCIFVLVWELKYSSSQFVRREILFI